MADVTKNFQRYLDAIQAKLAPPDESPNNIKVTILECTTNCESLKVIEKSDSVKFRAPPFRARASIEITPNSSSEEWTIGWIQVCTEMKFHNYYGHDGFSSWEFPLMTSGMRKVINDSNNKEYPWYGDKEEIFRVRHSQSGVLRGEILMEDWVKASVSWNWPGYDYREKSQLTRTVREQSFNVWLAAWNHTENIIYPLKTIKWSVNLELEVNTSLQIGHRVRVVKEPPLTTPMIGETATSIPRCGLFPPCANNAQKLFKYTPPKTYI